VHRLGLSNREIKPLKADTDSSELKKVQKRGRPRKNQTIVDEQKPSKDSKRGKLNLSMGITNKRTEKKESSKNNSESTEGDSLGVVSDLSEETLKSLMDIENKSKKISLMDLTERTCKWPIGDPATEKFCFRVMSTEPKFFSSWVTNRPFASSFSQVHQRNFFRFVFNVH
jgi:GcrA cell cycle regulator